MLCSFLLFDHNTLSYGYRLLFENNSLLLRGKSKSSLFNFLQIFFDRPDLLAVFSSTKLDNNCITFFADAMARFNMIRRNTSTHFVKNIQYLLLYFFLTNFTRNGYNGQTFSSRILDICPALLL